MRLQWFPYGSRGANAFLRLAVLANAKGLAAGEADAFAQFAFLQARGAIEVTALQLRTASCHVRQEFVAALATCVEPLASDDDGAAHSFQIVELFFQLIALALTSALCHTSHVKAWEDVLAELPSGFVFAAAALATCGHPAVETLRNALILVASFRRHVYRTDKTGNLR